MVRQFKLLNLTGREIIERYWIFLSGYSNRLPNKITRKIHGKSGAYLYLQLLDPVQQSKLPSFIRIGTGRVTLISPIFPSINQFLSTHSLKPLLSPRFKRKDNFKRVVQNVEEREIETLPSKGRGKSDKKKFPWNRDS